MSYTAYFIGGMKDGMVSKIEKPSFSLKFQRISDIDYELKDCDFDPNAQVPHDIMEYVAVRRFQNDSIVYMWSEIDMVINGVNV